MTLGALVMAAFALALDATAVSAARGMAVPAIRISHVLLVAGFFGGFQALMPLIGWSLGAWLGALVGIWDHWIAFALLSAIGGKMLWEARGGSETPERAPTSAGNPFAIGVMLLLAVATSIDALAVGVTLPLLGAPLLKSLVVIGSITAALSVMGLFAGRKLGALLGRRLDAAGGLMLIALGLKILVEHLQA